MYEFKETCKDTEGMENGNSLGTGKIYLKSDDKFEKVEKTGPRA